MPHIAGFRGVVFDPAGPTERDATRALYRYHQRFPGPGRTFERRSIIIAVALSPFDEGVVRPHEATTAADRAAALAAITRDGGYTLPVLLGFRDPATEVDRLFRKIESSKVTVELTTPACPVKDQMRDQARAAVMQLPGVTGVDVKMSARVRSRCAGSSSAATPATWAKRLTLKGARTRPNHPMTSGCATA